MKRRSAKRFRLLATGAAVLGGTAVFAALPAAAAAPTCETVSIKTLSTALGIAAVHVTSVQPAKNPKPLIFSHYGNSGRAANEATINYLPTTRKSFALLKATNESTHQVRTVTGLKSGAFSYEIGTERYLYVLNGTEQVQMFAIVPLAKLETLARKMPTLS